MSESVVRVGQFRKSSGGDVYEVVDISEERGTCTVVYRHANGDFQERYGVELRYVAADEEAAWQEISEVILGTNEGLDEAAKDQELDAFIKDTPLDRQTKVAKLQEHISDHLSYLERQLDEPVPEPVPGRKFDNGKPEFSLLPLKDLEGVVRVLEYGAKKYDRHNWRKVENGEQRYLDAALRHLAEIIEDFYATDNESGLRHIDHAICSLIFARAHSK